MNSRKKMIAKIVLTALCLIAVGAIFFNSSLDADTSTKQSDPLVDEINQFFESIHIHITITDKMVRKTAHFTEYAVLGALLSATLYLYVGRRRDSFAMTLPLGCAIALCDEVIQLFPKGRSCEITDVMIDSSGILFSALIVRLILYMIDRHHRKKGRKKRERFIAE